MAGFFFSKNQYMRKATFLPLLFLVSTFAQAQVQEGHGGQEKEGKVYAAG